MGIARLKLRIYQPIRSCNARNGAKRYFLKSDIVNYVHKFSFNVLLFLIRTNGIEDENLKLVVPLSNAFTCIPRTSLCTVL
jgi:hypothetical protein